jgi:NFU1 iron-sulfur cluster scaffold homolog, mitochondrial
MNIPVNVYAESTPNPASMKFVASVMLLPEGIVEYRNPSEADASPLAKQLFSFSGVKSVFISSNFITVTKNDDLEWFEIMNIIREFIRGYLMSGEKVFISNPFENPEHIGNDQPSGKPAQKLPEGETELKIVQILDEYVKPAVEQDGGAIHFKSFNEGVVTVSMRGSCSGCPSSTLTLKSGIENLLRQMVPGVTEVVAEAE